MSSQIDKLVREATKPKAAPPKAKYIDPILATTFSQDRSLSDVCRALGSRMREKDAVVVYKALIVLHNMIRNGGVENVLSHVAQDEAGSGLKAVAGRSSGGASNVPRIVRAYASYLDDRVRAYRELRHDVIRSSDSNKASSNNRLRRLTVDKGLLREVGITQKVGNAALNCDFFAEDVRDELTLTAFRMAFKDVLALYAAINEGVINILEHYFEMAKTDAQRSLELYKRFCAQTEKVVAYMAAARKASGALNFTVPSLKHAPIGLAGALQEYLDDPNFEQNRIEYKENKRIADGGTPSKKPAATPVKKEEPEKKKEAEKKEEAPAVKPPTNNQDLQDFFASIETNQTNNMFSMGPQDAWFGGPFGGVQPQVTGFAHGGIAPQMTGYNPFLTQQPTGFGGMQQPFMQPQMTGFVQPQATGFNPFRQSMMMQPPAGGLGSPFGTFGVPASSSQPTMAGPPQPVQTQATGFPGQPNTNGNTGAMTSASLAQTSAPQPASLSAPAPAKILPQQTGSRNPFAPPPGSIPVPEPPKLTGPTLSQLASGQAGSQPSGGNYGLGANAWDGKDPTQPNAPSVLKPQQTGLMGSVASEFTNLNMNASPSGSSTPVPPANGAQSLFGTSQAPQNGSSAPPTSAPIAPQPTGFGGIKPFKPESNFGSSLASNPAFQLPGAGTVGDGSAVMTPQYTGNPFARTAPAPAPTGTPGSNTAGTSLFGTSSVASSTTGNTSLSSQPTGFTSPFFSPQQQQTQLTQNQLNGSHQSQQNGQNGIVPQPTGFAGSTVKPFQPTSAFGTSAFGSGSLF